LTKSANSLKINGLDIFYREAGPKHANVLLRLHGFPTSSHMFRNLIPTLADEFHLVAPDYPGYGNSSMPGVVEFEYTFGNLVKMDLDAGAIRTWYAVGCYPGEHRGHIFRFINSNNNYGNHISEKKSGWNIGPRRHSGVGSHVS
jgi:pimeloyl-ACP methyl ester carboxylesterase